MGPYFAGVLHPRNWIANSNAVTLEIMRIVLATGLFAIGVELPRSYMSTHAKSLIKMVVPTMAIGWVIVAGKTPHPVYFCMSDFSSRTPACNFSCVGLCLLLGCRRMLDADRPNNMRGNFGYVHFI